MGSRSTRGTGVLPFFASEGPAKGLLESEGEMLRVKSAGFMLGYRYRQSTTEAWAGAGM